MSEGEDKLFSVHQYMEDAQDTGEWLPFLKAISLIFREVDMEDAFNLCLSEVKRGLSTITSMELIARAQSVINEIEHSAPTYHIEGASISLIDATPYNQEHIIEIVAAINKLIEAVGTTDDDWKRELLRLVYQRSIQYQIANHWRTIHPDFSLNDAWKHPDVIEFRKKLFDRLQSDFDVIA